MYKRPAYDVLLTRLEEPRRFVQVLAGPRQVGKTTLVLQVLDSLSIPSHYASADEPVTRDRVWIEQQWDTARRLVRGPDRGDKAVLVLDEVCRRSPAGRTPSSSSGTGTRPTACLFLWCSSARLRSWCSVGSPRVWPGDSR